MLATSTKSTCQSPTSPSPHARSSRSLPVTTPHGLPPRTPTVSQKTTTQSSKIRKPPSPGYFGFAVGDGSDPPDSNPGKHARHNWEHSCSNGRGTANAIQFESYPQLQAFPQQTEFPTLQPTHAGLSASGWSESGNSQSNKRPTDRTQRESFISLRSAVHPGQPAQPASPSGGRTPQGKAGATSFFDVPRRESPAALSPGRVAVEDPRSARLSLPANNLLTPPEDHGQKQIPRAETLPGSLHADGPSVVPSQEFVSLLNNSPSKILLLDLRVAPQYSVSRIRGAMNLCIPTTLMKRPSFNTQKLRDTFSSESDRQKFSQWRNCDTIAVYDFNSSSLKEAHNPVNILKKFSPRAGRVRRSS